MPLPLELSHTLLRELSAIRKEGKVMKYLRPDAKSQVTIEYSDDHKPVRIDTIVISTQHDDFGKEAEMLAQIKKDVINILVPRVMKKLPKRVQALFNNKINYHVNPTGKFVIGGPHGDTGLTGRKIIVDTYGGKGAHGGGAFSGKDPSKVDRSAAYAARHVAKHLVAAGVCDEALVQVAYAIGVADPVGLFVNTYGTSKVNMTDGQIAAKIGSMKDFNMRPYFIEQRFKLRTPIYRETAAYGHMGRECKEVTKVFNKGKKNEKKIKVTLFPWENLNAVPAVKKAFGIK
jgi:S-adenosylmethionine synthetase